MDNRIVAKELPLDAGTLDAIAGLAREFRGEPIVLEKNENSDLADSYKPSTQEFFREVFGPDGPFWSVYSELGIAVAPQGLDYVAYVDGQMYFVKNVEKKYLNGVGPEKRFKIVRERLVENAELSIPSILLRLTAPIDALKQHARVIELGFLANEAVKEYEDFRSKTQRYCAKYSGSDLKDPLETAKDALEKAVSAIKYSNIAMLCYAFKIRLRETESIERCESEELRELLEQKDLGSIRERFGYYSLTPYDISKPRFREGLEGLERYGAPEAPKDYALKWRENAKHLCARYLDIERMAYEEIGRSSRLGSLVYYLSLKELEEFIDGGDVSRQELRAAASRSRGLYASYERTDSPSRIVYYRGKTYIHPEGNKSIDCGPIKAVSVSSKKSVKGPAVNINSLEDYDKCGKGSIIISKTLAPNLTILYRKAAAVVAENGGSLAHAAVIAREMDIPCLIQAELPGGIKDGQMIEVDGDTGEIRILDRPMT